MTQYSESPGSSQFFSLDGQITVVNLVFLRYLRVAGDSSIHFIVAAI